MKEQLSLNAILQEEVASLRNKLDEQSHELNQNASELALLSEEKHRNIVLEQ